MAYVKVGPWVNGGAPPISAANLDTIETQYELAVADIAAATREFFVPVTWEDNGLRVGANDPPPRVRLTNGQRTVLVFYVPHDFTAITEAVIIVIPNATQGAANWDILSTYGAVGEAYTNHTENDVAATYNVVLNQYFEVDISGILSVLAAGDYVGIKLTVSTAGHDVDVVGIRFKYS